MCNPEKKVLGFIFTIHNLFFLGIHNLINPEIKSMRKSQIKLIISLPLIQNSYKEFNKLLISATTLDMNLLLPIPICYAN